MSEQRPLSGVCTDFTCCFPLVDWCYSCHVGRWDFSYRALVPEHLARRLRSVMRCTGLSTMLSKYCDRCCCQQRIFVRCTSSEAVSICNSLVLLCWTWCNYVFEYLCQFSGFPLCSSWGRILRQGQVLRKPYKPYVCIVARKFTLPYPISSLLSSCTSFSHDFCLVLPRIPKVFVLD